MPLPANDRNMLRELVRRIAEIAALPVHREKARLWTKLNNLEPVRPMVWLNEHCWHELDVDDELTLRCEDDWARGLEDGFRKLLYNWDHLRCDMIVSDYVACPLVVSDTGFGISEDVDIVRTDPASGVVSRRFHPQIVEPKDIEKIRMPEIALDEEATEENYAKTADLFGDLMPVRKEGIKRNWCSPWDNLIRLWGVEEAMMDLVMRPEMVNAAVSRYVEGYLRTLDQWEALNLLSRNDDNTRVGSGAYGYVDELPGEDFDPNRVRSRNMWGCAAAQIFSEVSPDMHWEFALRHEMRWLERWGLTYYGCCEPLDRKLGILRRIPNLRKISMSPWVNAERAAREIGADYVYSCKPNPAILAEDTWRPHQARRELRDTLERTRGCRVEIVMKDISTVRYQPRRLWEWCDIAMELAEEFAP